MSACGCHPSGAITTSEIPIRLYSYVLGELNKLNVAYLSLIEARSAGGMDIQTPQATAQLRRFWPKPLIVAGGFTKETAEQAIREGRADAVAFGRFFVANPDLVERFRRGAPLNDYDRSKFYGGGAAGYIDYPALKSAKAAE